MVTDYRFRVTDPSREADIKLTPARYCHDNPAT